MNTKSRFLEPNEIKIGSWWAIAQGGGFGYVVLSVNLIACDATVLSTDGSIGEIDIFKLQYKYKNVVPNSLERTRLI